MPQDSYIVIIIGLSILLLMGAIVGYARWRTEKQLKHYHARQEAVEAELEKERVKAAREALMRQMLDPAYPHSVVLSVLGVKGSPELASLVSVGFPKALINALQKAPEILVLNDLIGAPELTSEFNARLSLSGSAILSADSVMVQLKLTEAASGYQYWTDRYDRAWGDWPATLQSIAETIVFEISRIGETPLTLPKSEEALSFDAVQAKEWITRGFQEDSANPAHDKETLTAELAIRPGAPHLHHAMAKLLTAEGEEPTAQLHAQMATRLQPSRAGEV